MRIQVYPISMYGKLYKAKNTVSVFSDDEFRFALHNASLDDIQVDCITLPVGSLGNACKDTLDKFLTITDNVVAENFKLIWRE